MSSRAEFRVVMSVAIST